MQLGRKLAEGYAVDNTEINERPETPQAEPVTAEERVAEPVAAVPAQA